MGSAGVPAATTSIRRAPLFTATESTFRNAKFRTVSLIAYKAAADVGAKGALFVLTVLAARRFSQHDFGVFALGTTVGWLLSVVTDFGVQLHVARAVAQTPDAAPRLLRQWGRVRMAASLGGLAMFTLALTALRAGPSWTVPLLIFAFAYTATSLVEFLNYFYRGLSRTDIESTVIVCQRAATLIAGIWVLVRWPSPTALALAMLVPATVALVWSGSRAIATQPPPTVAAPAFPEFQQFVGDVFPLGLGIVISALYFRIDVLLVQWWAGTDAVARYNAVFRLIDALRLLPAAVLAVMLPELCRAADRRTVTAIASSVTGFALLAAAALWVGADLVVTLLYGSAYRSAVPAFRVLALTFPLLSMNYALTHQLVAWNRQHAYAAICAVALAANVLLNAWLIPWLSIVGAAWATFGTEVVLTSGCLVVLRVRP